MEKARVLEQLIKEQGMNPRSFSEKCGLPYSTVYTILKKGAGKANVNNVITMCKVLGITVEITGMLYLYILEVEKIYPRKKK